MLAYDGSRRFKIEWALKVGVVLISGQSIGEG